MKITITRNTETRFTVILQDEGKSDIDMILEGKTLKMGNSFKGIRVSTWHVDLGPKSFAAVTALGIGETFSNL